MVVCGGGKRAWSGGQRCRMWEFLRMAFSSSKINGPLKLLMYADAQRAIKRNGKYLIVVRGKQAIS